MSSPSRKKGGLGRGLASLIPTGPAEDGAPRDAMTGPRMGAAAADVVIGGGAAAAPAGARVGVLVCGGNCEPGSVVAGT